MPELIIIPTGMKKPNKECNGTSLRKNNIKQSLQH